MQHWTRGRTLLENKHKAPFTRFELRRQARPKERQMPENFGFCGRFERLPTPRPRAKLDPRSVVTLPSRARTVPLGTFGATTNAGIKNVTLHPATNERKAAYLV
jgi:hypothetical protein